MDDDNQNIRYIKLGKTTSKKIETNFDEEYDKFKKIALERGYDGDIKFFTEKKIVNVYAIFNL